MTIRLGNHSYPLDGTWITALRYRSRYGVSYVCEDTGNPTVQRIALVRLCYVAIIGDKPEESAFIRDAMANALFLRAAEAFRNRLYRPDASTDGIKHTPTDERPDELHTAAAWAHCRLSERLLGELSVSQVAGLLHIYNKITSGDTALRPMSENEQSEMYGISAALEDRIAEYMAGEGAEHGGEQRIH